VAVSAVVRIVIWSVVFFLLVGVFAAAMAGEGNFIWNLTRWDDFDFDDRDYSVGNANVRTRISELSIDWVDGSVTVAATDGDEILITENYEGGETAYRLRWKIEDGELDIKYCKPKIHLPLFGDESVPKDLHVLIPRSMLDGLEEIHVSTVSAVQNINVSARELDSSTVSGAVYATGTYRDVEIETVSGDVSVDGVVERGSFDGVSGEVNLCLREQAEQLDMDTVSGDLRLTLPDSTAGFRVNVDSLSGDADIRGFALERRQDDTWGDGSMEINVDSISGKLIIEKETRN
jgi:hypothetical protein